jgi:ElaB/YqjD/DUF883 family membrane-anchored ribosome-binding protein
MSDMTAAEKDKLMADLRTVVADAEALLKLTAQDVSEGALGVRQRLQERLAQARDGIAGLQSAATEKAKAVGHAADDYVHEHPWQSVAMGAGIGLVVGLLLARR